MNSFISPFATNALPAPIDQLRKFEQVYEKVLKPIESGEETFIWVSGEPHPLLNFVGHLRGDAKVDEILERFPSPLPLAFWVHPANEYPNLAEDLRERGFQPIIACPFMSYQVKEVDSPSFEIRLAPLAPFLEVIGIGFAFDPVVLEGYGRLMAKPGVENYLLFIEETPVCSGTLIGCGKFGGIFNIATLPEYKKRGCARAMMQFLMRRAGEMRMEELFLISSPEAVSLYSALGFSSIFTIELFARGLMSH